jgi:queuine tRNA-ribosyltransferase
MSTLNITHRDSKSKARAGVLQTVHGPVETPVFMPVGTQATVKTMDSLEIDSLGYRILLGNTYHLFLRPGLETLKKAGGLHKFMAWPNAILTDSGGYQVFSLATRCRIEEDGVEFSSHVDGSRRKLTPEITTRFQLDIGSDIAMCLDDCPPYPSLEKDVKDSLERTTRWALRCRKAYDEWLKENSTKPLLFGIAQGSSFDALRKESAKQLVDIGFPGYAIGGLGLGEPRDMTWKMAEASLSAFPDEAPHYLMGFGQPEDMWEGVERGIDMFDCVLPTRNGRNGQAFLSTGRLNLFNARFKEDFTPLDPDCDCHTCRTYTRGYLCHLFRAGEYLAPKLVTLHNLAFMIRLMRQIRKSIIDGTFQEHKRSFFSRFDPS